VWKEMSFHYSDGAQAGLGFLKPLSTEMQHISPQLGSSVHAPYNCTLCGWHSVLQHEGRVSWPRELGFCLANPET
jgi:hypothetical protein